MGTQVNGQMKVLQDRDGLSRIVETMASEIRSKYGNAESIAIVGVRTRGVNVAERLRAALSPGAPERIPLGILDITLYRDDLSTLGQQPIVGPTILPFDVDGRLILLADDVIFTGRTVRAALEALVAFGRPSAVRLAVLVDRGHREYPLQPDVTGLKVETTLNQIVQVRFDETDGEDGIVLVTRPS